YPNLIFLFIAYHLFSPLAFSPKIMSKMVAVTIKESSLVKPAEATWTGRMPLSEFDMTGTITHIDTLYFYNKPTTSVPQNDVALVNLLKDSLSRTLVAFYPLAGRLHPIGGGRLELDCNGAGVQFNEAHAETTSLDELLGLFGSDVSGTSRCSGTEFLPLVPAVDYGRLGINEWPLLLVQLTRFSCGGICLGFNNSHVAADGLAAMHFFHEWARVARGQGIGTLPVLDRRVLRAGLPPLAGQPAFDPAQFHRPPVLLPDAECSGNNGRETAATRLRLTKPQVQILKDMANKNIRTTRPYTTYETLTAHTWRCACKARKLNPDQPTTVDICVDARRRINPPLPDAYFGDAIFDVKATSLSGDLVRKGLGYAAGKVREAVAKVDSKFLWSAIEYLKNQPDMTKFLDFNDYDDDREPYFGIPNLVVTSWLRLPMLGLDFGFGKEVHMDTTFEFDGVVTLSESQAAGDVVVSICLRSDHIHAFNRFFYDDISMHGTSE
ncbi:unnamed protein product, partial [Linum tenue]